MEYPDFIEAKTQLSGGDGFDPKWLPDFLFDFQAALVEWALLGGRRAVFADCGLGKTPMELVWAANVAGYTEMPVLLATPLAVSYQILREAEKFGIDDVARSSDGTIPRGARIVVTNYERVRAFNPNDFGGMVCDESSILKNFNGTRRKEVTRFMRKMPFRLLGTATAAPNDFIELGTSAEALGAMGHTDMLTRFFTNEEKSVDPYRTLSGEARKWRFKGHAELSFWRWVCSWARACRRPSDLGFTETDARFVLPALEEHDHVIKATKLRDGMLFNLPAVGLAEQREERRNTIADRCEKIAALVDDGEPALVWCHLNDESSMLARLIPDAVEVRGSDHDDEKEARLLAFAEGRERVLITKPKIGAWGLNLQGCAHVTAFPSHSYEQYYQGIRRCWRFGQERPVRVDMVLTEGEVAVLANLRRKSVDADKMFTQIVREMNMAATREEWSGFPDDAEVPAWLA